MEHAVLTRCSCIVISTLLFNPELLQIFAAQTAFHVATSL